MVAQISAWQELLIGDRRDSVINPSAAACVRESSDFVVWVGQDGVIGIDVCVASNSR